MEFSRQEYWSGVPLPFLKDTGVGCNYLLQYNFYVSFNILLQSYMFTKIFPGTLHSELSSFFPNSYSLFASLYKDLIMVCHILNLQYFGHLIRRVDSLEETLMLGGIEGRRTRDN